jgi:hypothetical protein
MERQGEAAVRTTRREVEKKVEIFMVSEFFGGCW